MPIVFIEYRDYLLSNAWRVRAMEVRARWDWKCALCGRDDSPIEVHHNSYVRLGREAPHDLIPLCEDCHGKHHHRMRLIPQEIRHVPVWVN